jgi:hypothetical protein
VFPIYSFLSPASPFPTRWLPRVGSPLFLRYYEAAKTSGCSFPRSSFPSNDGYLLDSCFPSLASGPWSCSRYAWALVYRSRHLAPVLSQKEEAVGSLKFPGNPLVLLPCSQTPVGSPRQALLRRFDSALAFRTTKAPTSIILSRLNHTALAPAPYASCRHRCRLRNVRFRLVASLCRVGFFSH